jgi:hypothetical protein
MIIYIDENISQHLAKGLDIIQKKEFPEIEVISTIDAFGIGSLDEDWLPQAGNNNACVVTRDFQIHRSKNQNQVYMQHNLGMFFLKSSDPKGLGYWDIVEMLIKHWPEIANTAQKKKRPFAYRFGHKAKLEDISK